MVPAAAPSPNEKPAAVLVVGGGIAGMRAALDLANTGLKVTLVEHSSSLGGVVAQLGYMFPQHDCVLCRGTSDHGYGCTRPSTSPAYTTHNLHPNIQVRTKTHVMEIQGQAGDFTVSVRQEAQYIDPARCINCGYCAEVCPVEFPDLYQQGMTAHKAVHKFAARAIPDAYVLDRGSYCDDCGRCEQVCPSKAINLQAQPRLSWMHVGAIILALGFQSFDPVDLEELGYGRFPNVVTALEYERLASRSGPTEGMVIRPSDHRPPRSIAWLQCIGSRSRGQEFCSSICCMYATKEAILAKQRLGEDVRCRVFMMDERAFNKEYVPYFEKARSRHNIAFTRCRLSSVEEDPLSSDLILHYASPDGISQSERFELVVLSTGMQPPESAAKFTRMLDLELNEYGFCRTDKFTPLATSHSGVFVCGAFSSPKEISETIIGASGAAAEVMRLLNDRLNTYPHTHQYPFHTSETYPSERDDQGKTARTGVFLCTCGKTMAETLDYAQISRTASNFEGVSWVQQVDYACFPEGTSHIKQMLRDQDVNRVVIAGCSGRTHESLFQRIVREEGLNPYLFDLVNLKDQCSRVHKLQKELATRKAQELIRIAIGRVSFADPIHKKKFRCDSTALVIGGGLAGMTASLAMAESGFKVVLVERSPVLGGNLQNMYYVAEGYNPRRLGRDLINRVRSHPGIQMHTRTEVIKQRGHVGEYRTTLQTVSSGGAVNVQDIEHGVTIVATGGQEARSHPWLEIPGVITQQVLEEMVIHQPEKIAALKNVVMIQCVTVADRPEYCSRVCCTNTMKNAIRLRLFNPNCRVTVLYKNIVTYGFRESYYTEARRLGSLFVRYDRDRLPEIRLGSDSRLSVTVADPALARELEIPADLIVLSMPILPSRGTADLAEILRVPISVEGFFNEAQLKLRPMDFTREGIFLAGMAHYPKFIEESISQALATAGRAITLMAQGDSFYLGGVVAVVDPDKCVGCFTCTRVCPFGIPQVVENAGRNGVGDLGGAAFIDETLCQGCGTCTGECPANAIQLSNYTDDQILLRDIGGLGSWMPEPEAVAGASMN